MRKDVHEKVATGSEPLADTAKELAPVQHVLKHFDRHHPIKLPVNGEVIHIAGDDANIRQTTSVSLRFDVAALG